MIVVSSRLVRSVGEKVMVTADEHGSRLKTPVPGMVMREATISEFETQLGVQECFARFGPTVRKKWLGSHFYLASVD